MTYDAHGRITTLVAAFALVSACGGETTSPETTPVSVVLSPPTTSLVGGGTLQLSAVVKNAAGSVLTGTTVTYASDKPAIATVSATGLATAVGPVGSANITGRAGTVTSTPAVITVSAAAAQNLAKSTDLPAAPEVGNTYPVTVKAADSFGNPVAGVIVTFAATGGGGSVTPTTATTDASGLALTYFVPGITVGTNTVTATAAGLAGSPVTFSTVSVASVANRIVKIGTDPTSVVAGASFSDSIRVQVRDAFGNGKPGVSVAFAVTAGGGSIAPATATTDVNGKAAAKFTTGSTSGTNSATATVASLGAVSFFTTASPPSFSVSVRPLPIARDSSFVVEATISDTTGVAYVDAGAAAMTRGPGSKTFTGMLHSAASRDDVTVIVQTHDSNARVTASDTFSFPTRPQRYSPGIAGIPRPDSILHQLGLVISVDSARAYDSFAWTVDSFKSAWSLNGYTIFPVPTLLDGTHTAKLTLWKTDSLIARFDTSFTFTTRVDPRSYQLTILSALSGDDNAIGNDMNDSGVVVGASSNQSTGSLRAVRWVNGQISALPVGTVSTSWANSVNQHGEIVGTTIQTYQDSALLWLPANTAARTIGASEGLRINNARQVLLGAPHGHYPGAVKLYDIASDTSILLWASGLAVDLNERGQVVGHTDGYSESFWPTVYGISLAPLPQMMPLPGNIGHSYYVPIDMNDVGEILLADQPDLVLSRGSSSILLSPFIGRVSLGSKPARLNNRGLIVVVQDSALYLWHESTQLVERVATDPEWRFDGVSRVNDAGVILAHGWNSSTSQRGTVILSPVP